MVFHRFLTQQGRRAFPLTINVKGNRSMPGTPSPQPSRHSGGEGAGLNCVRPAGPTPGRCAAVHPAEPDAVLDREGVGGCSGPEEVEQAAGVLHLSRGASDTERRMEPTQDADEHTKLARIAIDIPRPQTQPSKSMCRRCE